MSKLARDCEPERHMTDTGDFEAVALTVGKERK
jgi:hypothetical protein